MLGKRPPTRCETAEAEIFEQTSDSESELGLDFCDSPGGLRKARKRRNLLIPNPPFPDKIARQASQTWVSALPSATPTPNFGPLTMNPSLPTYKSPTSDHPTPPQPYTTTFMSSPYHYSGPLSPSGLPHGYGALYPPDSPTHPKLRAHFINGLLSGPATLYDYVIFSLATKTKGLIKNGIFTGPVKFYSPKNTLKEIGKMKDDNFDDEFYGVYNSNGKMNFHGGKRGGSREGFGVEYYSNGQISYVGEFENDFYRMQQSQVGAIMGRGGKLVRRFKSVGDGELLDVYNCCLKTLIENFCE